MSIFFEPTSCVMDYFTLIQRHIEIIDAGIDTCKLSSVCIELAPNVADHLCEAYCARAGSVLGCPSSKTNLVT